MSTAASSPNFDAATARLLEDAHSRRASAPPRRERTVEAAFAGVTLLAALLLAGFVDAERTFSLPLAALFVGVYVAVNRVEFPLGDGIVVPTQLVLVPMLLLLPTPLVPLLVAVGAVVTVGMDVARGARVPQRIAARRQRRRVRARARGGARGAPRGAARRGRSWPAYVAALAAQFAADAVRECARGVLTERMAPRVVLAELVQVFRLDAMLAPARPARRPRGRRRSGDRGARAPARLAAGRLRARARGAHRPDDRTRTFLPRHRDAAARSARGRRRVHRPPHRGRRRPLRARRRADGRQRGRAPRDRARRAPARHRQDPHPGRDHQQARRARRRRVGADEDAHDRGPEDARPRRRPAHERRRRRARLPRALRRRRLPRRPGRRARSRSPRGS